MNMRIGGGMDSNVTARLRAARLAAGMSQRALAKRAEVSSSTVSLIEAGKMNPSLGALKRIANAIPISLSELFSDDFFVTRSAFCAAENMVDVGRGGVEIKTMPQRGGAQKMSILLETYDVGAQTGRVHLTHGREEGGEEGGVVISGRVEVMVGDERKILGPGDAYYFHSALPHRFRQVGPEPCVLVSACTPSSF